MMLKDDISSKFDVEFIEEENKKEITTFKTKYVNNLRSGENIEFDGDVIVMTDMKSGSQVSATCNVVVMGDISSGARVVARGNVTVMGSVSPSTCAGDLMGLLMVALRSQGNWRWEGPLGTPLGLVHWKRASSPVEAGTAGYL